MGCSFYQALKSGSIDRVNNKNMTHAIRFNCLAVSGANNTVGNLSNGFFPGELGV